MWPAVLRRFPVRRVQTVYGRRRLHLSFTSGGFAPQLALRGEPCLRHRGVDPAGRAGLAGWQPWDPILPGLNGGGIRVSQVCNFSVASSGPERRCRDGQGQRLGFWGVRRYPISALTKRRFLAGVAYGVAAYSSDREVDKLSGVRTGCPSATARNGSHLLSRSTWGSHLLALIMCTPCQFHIWIFTGRSGCYPPMTN